VGYFTSPAYPFGYRSGTRILHKIQTPSAAVDKIIRIRFLDIMFTSHGFVCSQHDDNLRVKGIIPILLAIFLKQTNLDREAVQYWSFYQRIKINIVVSYYLLWKK